MSFQEGMHRNTRSLKVPPTVDQLLKGHVPFWRVLWRVQKYRIKYKRALFRIALHLDPIYACPYPSISHILEQPFKEIVSQNSYNIYNCNVSP